MRARSEWTLREKIGQMVMCGFDGMVPTDGIRELIREYRVGGIIYFRRNVGRPEEIAGLSAELRRLAAEVSDVPLWIAVDQEGGMVARIDRGVALMPGNMAIGATRDVGLAYETAHVSALELRQMGINVNLAPCLDVNNNPANPVIGVRSFGERPELVAELGAAAVSGYQDAGVVACAKHFPGHGDTAADSHLELPLIPHDRERLDAVELMPFRAAIEAGVDAIMTAHVRFPAYEDSDLSATISSRILTGLLRERLGFEGVIFTDCLEMKAITDTVGVGAGAVLAVKAGADVVLVSHQLERQRTALDALYQAVVDGEISEERIDASVRRILAVKEKRAAIGGVGQKLADDAGLAERASGAESSADTAGGFGRSAALASIGSEPHLALARRVSEQSVTLVKNSDQVLPLRRDVSTLVLWPEVRQSTETEEIIKQNVTLGSALARYITRVKELKMSTLPTAEEVQELVQAAKASAYPQIVVGTYNAAFAPGQRELVNRLLELAGVNVIVAALRNPYDLLEFPKVPVYLACYENRPMMMEALAKVLVGQITAVGRLPVTISEQYPYGHAAYS